MQTTFTVHDILERACQKEILSQMLYKDLAQKMKKQEAADAFNELVKQEFQHQLLIEKYINGDIGEGGLSPEHVVDYKLVEKLEQPEIAPDMELKDVFLVAAHREKMSHELYSRLAAMHQSGRIKKLLKELASQELKHKQIVEYLYSEVAFPQTDGG